MNNLSINNSPDNSLGTLIFPHENNQFLDRELGVDPNNQIVKVISVGSKVGTGFTKDYLDYQALPLLGHKPNLKTTYEAKINKFILGLNLSNLGYRFTSTILVLALVSFVLLATGLVLFISFWTNSPSLATVIRQPIQSSTVYARDGKTKIYEFFKEERREFVGINRIPRVVQLAVIALEDQNFYKNDQGIPWTNIVGSSQKCLLSGGDNCRGGSGLSQQLVKVMTNDRESSVNRKLKELVAAIKLNQEKNHTEILEAYLNWVAFGRNAYGVEQASRAYFGRSIDAQKDGKFLITPTESCFLAAMIQSPGLYPTGIGKLDSDAWKGLNDRKNSCLEKLRTVELPLDDDGSLGNFINTDQELKKWQEIKTAIAESDKAEEVRASGKIAFVTTKIEDPFPHFREYITEELLNMLGEKTLYEGGLKITTTLDPELQKTAEKIVQSHEKDLNAVGATNAASMVLDGPNGQILSMVGSLGYNRDDIDGKVNITTTPQQPGSSIKPYIYLNSWLAGYNPGTTLGDFATTWKDFTPRNFSGRFTGNVSMRYALQNSLNIPAVKALLLGPETDSDTGYVNAPDSPLERTLNGFFNLTDKLGVKFPCIASGDGDACNSSETAKNAYRKRCFISTALGGCEVTMVSHITGINALLQEGNLRTATPFISIVAKNSDGADVDLYEKYKNSFYPAIDAIVDPIVARQMENVLSDYQTRAAEFGNFRFNLELDNKAWKVAAKTGTSSGPKDFWVVGGSPYNTVAIWAGRNDNKDMDDNASSSRSAAIIWKEIMEAVHKDKAVKNFSTAGLEKYTINGKNELITPFQKTQLQAKGYYAEPKKKLE